MRHRDTTAAGRWPRTVVESSSARQTSPDRGSAVSKARNDSDSELGDDCNAHPF